MRISHKTVQEQMDAARRMEATDQALILCKQQQDRIAALESDNARLVGEVEKWRNAYCREQEKLKLSDEKQVRENVAYLVTSLNKSEADLQRHKEALDLVCEALNEIASWGQGEVVTGSFDEPASAQRARDALASLTTSLKT